MFAIVDFVVADADADRCRRHIGVVGVHCCLCV